ncbi:hypothetical protein B0H14DRAFT_2415221 [Mycena olivaceomarginata]|nr:hypothetical protein B0H14DRAFT_2415221 [Mycena olivaceomarginata]
MLSSTPGVPPSVSESSLHAAQCYNCHTTATPLWRKGDEGKTVWNTCGLYYKLHGSAHPISMKSDVIRKRLCHKATPQRGVRLTLVWGCDISSASDCRTGVIYQNR